MDPECFLYFVGMTLASCPSNPCCPSPPTEPACSPCPPQQNVLAKMVIERVPSVEMVRFVSSGTEACLSVLRLMRAYTGREKIIKFVGCYHGHADSFLVKAGSGVITLGLPDSPGVPKSTAAATLTATYNSVESVRELFEANKGEVAGVILEPVVGNSGFIPPTKEFLQGLRDLCTEHGAVLCFDEVMTGFRIAKVRERGRGAWATRGAQPMGSAAGDASLPANTSAPCCCSC